MAIITTVKNIYSKITGQNKPASPSSSSSSGYVELTPSGGFSTGGVLGTGGILGTPSPKPPPKPKPSPGGGTHTGEVSSPESITPTATTGMTESETKRLTKIKTARSMSNPAVREEVIRLSNYYNKTLSPTNKIRVAYADAAAYARTFKGDISQPSPLIQPSGETKEYYVYQASTEKQPSILGIPKTTGTVQGFQKTFNRYTTSEEKFVQRTGIGKVGDFVSKGVDVGLVGIPVFSQTEFGKSFTKSFLVESTIKKPVTTGLTFTAGAVIGGSATALRQTKTGMKLVKSSLGKTAKVGVGLGVGGIIAYKTGKEVIIASTPSERGAILGRTAQSLFVFGVGAKVGSSATALEKTITPLRPIKEPTFIETQKTFIVNDKPIRTASYKITGETRAPLKVQTTSALREYYYQKPKSVVFKPSKQFVTKTLGFEPVGKPFGVVTKEGTYGRLRFSSISGSSTPEINLRATDVKMFSPTQKGLVTGFGERLTGVPQKLEIVPKLIGKDERTYFGFVESKKLFSILRQGKKIFIKSPKPGKTRELAETFVKVKPLKENELFEVSEADVTFKGINKPFARSTGKTPGMRGIVLEQKEPITIGGTSLNIIQKAPIKKTPFSQTFQQQRTVMASIPKDVISKITKPSKTTTRQVTTSQTFVKAPKLSLRTIEEVRTKQIPTTKLFVKEQPSLVSKVDFKLQTKQQMKLIPKSILQEKSLNKLNIKQQPQSKIMQKTIQKVVQKEKVAFKPLIKIPGKTTTSSYFRTPIYRYPKPSFSLFRKRTKGELFSRSSSFKPPKRVPSLLAIGTGIKSTRKGIAEFSGFTVRPILISKRKKRRKK